jgi:hypothetical protein
MEQEEILLISSPKFKRSRQPLPKTLSTKALETLLLKASLAKGLELS